MQKLSLYEQVSSAVKDHSVSLLLCASSTVWLGDHTRDVGREFNSLRTSRESSD